MGSLNKCMTRLGIDKYEAEVLKGAAATLTQEGYEAHKAAEQAIRDRIADLQSEYDRVVAEVSAAKGPVTPVVEAKPEPTAPAETPVAFKRTGGGGKKPPPSGGNPLEPTLPPAPKELPYSTEIRPSVKLIMNAARDLSVHWAKKGLDALVFTQDLADIATRAGLKSAADFVEVINQKNAQYIRHETELNRIMEKSSNLRDRKAVNLFLRDSTRAGAEGWGFQPDWDADAKVNAGMAARFNALSPEGREIVKSIFQYGHDTYVKTQELITANAETKFETMVRKAKTAKEQQDILADKAATLKTIERVLPKRPGPYAPLRRFGNHVMVAQSQAYLDAVEAKDQPTINKLRSDPDHYVVSFFDSVWQSKEIERRAKASGRYALVESSPRQDLGSKMSEFSWASIQKIEAAINELPDDKGSNRALHRLVTDLYLNSLSDTSARKSELKADFVAGEGDMLQTFANQGRVMAHYTAALEHSADINAHLQALKTEAREGDDGTRNDRTMALNELVARYEQGMDFRPTPFADKALRVNSIWMLLTSPGYLMVNSTQPFMLSLPLMAAKAGYGKSWSALTKAYSDVFPVVKGLDKGIDIDRMPISMSEKEMLKKLLTAGKIDITISQDLGRWTEGESVLDKGVFGKVQRRILGLTPQLEMINRLSTALAAYRVSGGDAQFAGRVIDQSHGNYAPANAPRIFNSSGAAKLILQFRKFQLIQLSLLGRLAHQAFKGATPQEKQVARSSLGFLLAHHAVMAGALGLPAINIIGYVLTAAFGDEEEPKDLERMLREAIGDETTANLLLNGIPAALGVNLSSRVGMGTATSILPFNNADPLTRKGYGETMVNASGPFFGGLLPRWADGADKMRNGDYYKGLELLMPKGVLDAMRAYRFATEGVSTNQNEIALRPDEVSMLDALSQGLGVPSTALQTRQRRTGDVIEMEKFYRERVSDLKRDYVRAYRSQDTDGMQDARDQWLVMAEAQKRNGIKPTPLSTLIKAPREIEKKEKDMVEGVMARPSNRGFVEQNAGL